MIVTYKYRIKDKSARKHLVKLSRSVNQVWNYCVDHHKYIRNLYTSGAKLVKWPSQIDLCKLTGGVGKELGLYEQTIACINQKFITARNGNKKTIPRYRSSFGKKRSLGYIPFQTQSRVIKGSIISYLGKKFHLWGTQKRPIPANATGGEFVEDSLGRWFVCFYVDVEPKKLTTDNLIGIDLGLKTFATLSDGTKIDAQRIYRKWEPKLAAAQRANNKLQIKRIHQKIKNIRNDFLHKLSTELTSIYSFIAVGNVNSSQLAKTKMAKSVLDAGWSIFRSMLKYKATSYLEVDEKFTTQTCSTCDFKESLSRPRGIAGLGIRSWTCSSCNQTHDRDVNAAKNILKIALSTQRLAEGSRLIHLGVN
jgi:IS605 OrfB family transposase